jgi:hypothetical protein
LLVAESFVAWAILGVSWFRSRAKHLFLCTQGLVLWVWLDWVGWWLGWLIGYLVSQSCFLYWKFVNQITNQAAQDKQTTNQLTTKSQPSPSQI